ncbi:hypothetical protein [Halarsenatibacter silvermanii]|uniref:Uncharacterized protein n=1 Tax=Halarsenatibacter silvermanii TaxID=321763 RepID=A0A1G9HC85_9FIRM|nr:hypothetical protein [Halarsenatibacter silvermanii]SDL10648.1 hypothetical protein SAMN04488692_101173 [Halarsenatibacter silvermanii]
MITPQVKVHREKSFALTAQMHEHAVTFPDYSRREIRNRLEKYVPLGRKLPHLTIYLCSLGFDTPPDNIRAAVKAAREIKKGQF